MLVIGGRRFNRQNCSNTQCCKVKHYITWPANAEPQSSPTRHIRKLSMILYLQKYSIDSSPAWIVASDYDVLCSAPLVSCDPLSFSSHLSDRRFFLRRDLLRIAFHRRSRQIAQKNDLHTTTTFKKKNMGIL